MQIIHCVGMCLEHLQSKSEAPLHGSMFYTVDHPFTLLSCLVLD